MSRTTQHDQPLTSNGIPELGLLFSRQNKYTNIRRFWRNVSHKVGVYNGHYAVIKYI